MALMAGADHGLHDSGLQTFVELVLCPAEALAAREQGAPATHFCLEAASGAA